ncbi:MAG: two-component system sensor histidine kinase NtrB [Elusimicrobiota bacterium]
MHSLLNRQIKRHFGSFEEISFSCIEFIKAVGQSYRQFDEDRLMLERSMEISSEELVKANGEMHSLLQKLEKSMSLLRATLDSTADGILVVDKDCHISDFNQKFVEMWHLPLTLVTQKDDAKVIEFATSQLKDPETFVAKVKELYSQPEATSFDVLYFKDGRVFERYSQAQFSGNKIIGRVWSFRDITERKNLENKFIQSEKMSAVGQLAGGVAHEINNPLGVILGFAQSLKSRIALDNPLYIPVEHIEREAGRCKNLVQNLLTFSRTPIASQFESISINSAIEDAFFLIQAQSKFNTIELIKDLDNSLPTILANKNQIQQVVINLCNNAIDAMKENGTLSVKTFTSHFQNVESVAIQISDTGPGIPEDIKKNIFEPFFTTKEVGKGTGLGLSLVYEITQKHQGKIELSSELGKGATFTVYLPTNQIGLFKAA